MAKQSASGKATENDPALDAIYDPRTYEGFAVTGDWAQGFSVVLNGVPMKFTRRLGIDTMIGFEVWAEIMDGSTSVNVLLVKATYGEKASRLMHEFSRRSYDAITLRDDENRAKAMSAVTWAAGSNKG